MTSIFQRSAEFLSEKRHASMGVAVTYRRGEESAPITATPGRPEDDSSDVSGITVDADRADWILRAADLVLDDVLVEPEEGDEIDFVNGTTTQTYIVRRDEFGDVFKYADEFRKDIRVHTITKGTA